MSVNLFFNHLKRDVTKVAGINPSSATLSRRNHMVIAHGLLGNCNNWNTSSNMLLHHPTNAVADGASSYHIPTVTDIFQVDMRNHGNSPHTVTHHTTQMASDLEAMVLSNPLLNSTPADRCMLVGHSMGGIAVMHSLIRRANEGFYLGEGNYSYVEEGEGVGGGGGVRVVKDAAGKGGGFIPSTSEEVEIRDTLTDVNECSRNLNMSIGGQGEGGLVVRRPFYGKPPMNNSSGVGTAPSRLSSINPRVCGAIIVDIPPMQMRKGDKLGSVREIVKTMANLDLSKIHSSKEGDAALKHAGIADAHMRMFLMTNMQFSGGKHHHHHHHATSSLGAPQPTARWKCNVETLYNDLNEIMIPDEDPSTTNGAMRKVSGVPILFVFGSRSEYFQSLPRVESLIGKYFDTSSTDITIKVLEGCDHYPHYQAPKRYVETVSPFITKVFS